MPDTKSEEPEQKKIISVACSAGPDNVVFTVTGQKKFTVNITGEGTVSVDDGNGNTITLDKKDIRMHAGGDITLEAGGNIVLKSAGGIKMAGTELNGEATAVKIKGIAAAEFSSEGQTKVKGAVVLIN
jgi:hypothetical protein